jgi:hypothetical protein
MSTNIYDSLVIIATLAALASYMYHRRVSPSASLPPGPPQTFVLGNIPDMPMTNERETYDAWHAQYGKYLYFVSDKSNRF